jgi:D-serine deaminase-like pyridoxal phosphate-dependent protein
VALRPHTKTHKMPYIAKLQVDAGSCGIAVAKTGEAEVMAKNGIDDIFIANEIVGQKKLERISKLSQKISISFGVDSIFQVLEAEKIFSLDNNFANILVEIEVGENRSGIIEEVDFLKLLDTIKNCSHIKFKGIFSHDGNNYSARDIEECLDISLGAQQRTLKFAKLAKENGMKCEIVSYGSTPPFINNAPILNGINEIRPGTYVLMDASQSNSIGTLDKCAATILATVISKPNFERVILDVGAKGLTMQERREGICATEGKGTLYEFPDIHINKVFDEHAIINNPVFRESVKIGDKIRIIPVHICPVCNLYDEAWLISDDKVIKKIPVSCRGKLQ